MDGAEGKKKKSVIIINSRLVARNIWHVFSAGIIFSFRVGTWQAMKSSLISVWGPLGRGNDIACVRGPNPSEHAKLGQNAEWTSSHQQRDDGKTGAQSLPLPITLMYHWFSQRGLFNGRTLPPPTEPTCTLSSSTKKKKKSHWLQRDAETPPTALDQQ